MPVTLHALRLTILPILIAISKWTRLILTGEMSYKGQEMRA